MIFIDDREGSRSLADLIPDAVVVRLDAGDAMFEGYGPNGPCNIGVERKSISDLINSIRDGRLSGSQLPALLSSYYRSYLIVEGIWRPSTREGRGIDIWRWNHWELLAGFGGKAFNASALWSYLNTLEIIANVVVRSTSNMRETALFITNLCAWWQKPWSRHRSHLALYKPPPDHLLLRLSPPSLLRRIAAELPGIGSQRAMEVERHFKSVPAALTALESEWLKIPGIGKITAGLVWRALHEDK